MKTFVYFAYGSNMLTERLRAPTRCPSAKCLGVAAARGFRLCFSKRSKDGSGKATIARSAGLENVAYGILFEVTQNEREALDKSEGQGYTCDDAFSVVRLADEVEMSATAYLALPSAFDKNLKPYDWYRALVLAGALQHQLPTCYVETLRHTRVQRDPEQQRRERQEALRVLRCVDLGELSEKRPPTPQHSAITAPLPDDLEIAPRYTVGCWKGLALDDLDTPTSPDWKKAFEIFEARMRSRFFDPVDALIKSERGLKRKTFGFTILAIDCLLIETLQGFREGVCNHRNESEHLFTNFLKQWYVFKKRLPPKAKEDEWAKKIYKGYRCDLHHSGATRDAFRVLARGRVFAFKNDREISINRTLLHKFLKCKFEAYLTDLQKPEMSDPRRKFRKKMDFICGHARASSNV